MLIPSLWLISEAYNQHRIKESSGQMKVSGTVVIVDYDLRWPAAYGEEKQRILSVVGHRILCLEHIGSTAVAGLGAKPIIDIMAGVNSLSGADELLPLLRKIGYEHVIPQVGEAEWYYCLRKTVQGEMAWLQHFHLHLMKFGSETWEQHNMFRDFLRNHPEVARKYDGLKRELAAQYGVDREGYTKAKTEFINSVVTQAKRSERSGF